MKMTKRAQADRHHGVGTHSPSMVFSFSVSFFLHLTIIGLLIFMPEFNPRPKFRSGVVNVSLVSLPSPGSQSETPAATVVKEKKVEKPPAKPAVPKASKPKPVPVVKKPPEAVSLAPKKEKVKKSLKKKTFDRSKMIESAIDRIEKKVEKSKTDSVQSAIDQLKKEVAETESSGSQGAATSSRRAGSGGTGLGGGPGRGGIAVQESIRIYQAEIQYQIQKNWAFSQQLAGNTAELEAVLAIKVLRTGEIEDIWFDKKSGNAYLDESAYKAIVKSNPLPPLPNDYVRTYYKIGLIFGPKGLKRE
jgi:colicin import membrane protein